MKKVLMMIMIVFVLMLSSCQKETPKELELSLKTQHYDYENNSSDTIVYKELLREVKIESYEEYLGYIRESLDITNGFIDEDLLVDESYFENNILYVIPLYSEKMPAFELLEYEIVDGKLILEIEQINSLERFWASGIQYNYYALEVKINKKDIENIEYSLLVNDSYYDAHSFIELGLDQSITSMNDYLLFDDYNDYKDFVSDLDIYGHESLEMIELYDSKIFEDYVLLVRRKEVSGYNYLVVDDLMMKEDDDTKLLKITERVVGNNNAFIRSQGYVFILIEKEVVSDQNVDYIFVENKEY